MNEIPWIALGFIGAFVVYALALFLVLRKKEAETDKLKRYRWDEEDMP